MRRLSNLAQRYSCRWSCASNGSENGTQMPASLALALLPLGVGHPVPLAPDGATAGGDALPGRFATRMNTDWRGPISCLMVPRQRGNVTAMNGASTRATQTGLWLGPQSQPIQRRRPRGQRHPRDSRSPDRVSRTTCVGTPPGLFCHSRASLSVRVPGRRPSSFDSPYSGRFQ